MKKFILAVDEGTTSCRAVLFSTKDMNAVCSHSEPLSANYPQSGWVEQDANDIFLKQMLCVRHLFDNDGYDVRDVASIGITNQREAVVIWDKSGNALAPAVSWQCRRTADYCEELKARGLSDVIKQKTGLVIDAYFSATKLKWLLDNVKGAREKAEKGELLAGTLDSYLIYRMTGGKKHVTDVTNASRTMLFNINTLDYDDELLKLFDIPRNILPEVLQCVDDFGELNVSGIDLPIRGVAGDQQSALIGQACFNKGDAKCTYGTGAFILANVGNVPRITSTPLITTVAYTIGGKTAYAFEGSVFNAGSVVGWLKNIGLITSASETEEVARGVESSNGVYFIPAFTGLGAPYWDMNSRAAFFGITRGTTKNHIVRAALESIALRCGEVCDMMSNELDTPITSLSADGGVSQNGFLLQTQANVTGLTVKKSRETECTALGAAYLAAIGVGIVSGTEDIVKKHACDKIYEPTLNTESVKALKDGWTKAVGALISMK